MTVMSDSLTVVDPLDLVPRRRFSKLSAKDARALEAEKAHATSNLAWLKHDYLSRHPELGLTA